MSEQNTNFNTKQDKVTTGQEVTKSDLIKKNAPDNSLASVLLAAAFYSAIVYLAMFCLNPWGILLMIFQAPSLICYIIATILVWKGRKKGNKNFLSRHCTPIMGQEKNLLCDQFSVIYRRLVI